MMLKQMLMCGVALVSVAWTAPVEWMTDLEAAGKKAAAEQKLVLVEFTGSDWCGACKLQQKNVLDKPEFAKWANKHFVPAVVDVPLDVQRVGGAARKRCNEMLCEGYDIKSFPSLKVMSPELIILGGYGGAQRSPQAAIAMLEKSFAAAKKLEAAKKQTGEARTRALRALYEATPAQDKESRFHLLQLIVESDPEDKAGMHSTCRNRKQMRQVEMDCKLATAPEERLQIVQKAMAGAEPENVAELRERMGNAMREVALKLTLSPKSVQDVEKARDLLLESISYTEGENERTALRRFVEKKYADPAAIYEKRKK
ncbi:MAG: thioredoxin family protein [Akkermansia sp.]|nr:thioredoxin family protein [Akkermansia sp.]